VTKWRSPQADRRLEGKHQGCKPGHGAADGPQSGPWTCTTGAGPLQCDLAFLDVLLGRATLIVEAEDLLGLQGQVGDEKANAGEQFAGVPLHLGHYPARPVPGARLIFKLIIEPPHMVWRLADRALEQVCNSLLQHGVRAAHAD